MYSTIKKIDNESTTIRIRKLIGFLAFFLPTILLILPLFGSPSCWQTSISHNYYTSYREIFTGILMGIGLFMICYKTIKDDGEDDKKNNLKFYVEKYGSVLSGIMAILVAIFPTAPAKAKQASACFTKYKEEIDLLQYTLNENPNDINRIVHTGSAMILFIMLSVFSLYVFPSKKYEFKSNLLFKSMGVIIIFGILICVITNSILSFPYGTFFGEAIALYAFGISWLYKGYIESAN
ncbi:hypothetical protein VUJ46_03375 [Chryseobacterium sp. MYb264]|uniref:hypothetical protein n=1 Tax=Chryseobacterium sp. MYb264 TaxID=2745153 RepID=UPI002E11BD5F|nr:hypothetical protein VUJ46_03375 [Chryseobacterium sp. MYb264]